MAVFGRSNISDIYLGSAPIDAVFLGNTELYSSNKCFDLGVGQQFDVRHIPGWESFTNDNFFIVGEGYLAGSGSTYTAGVEVYAYGNVVKNYANGILNCYINWNLFPNPSGRGNVHVVCVTKPSKLRYLGYGQTFNIPGYSLLNFANPTRPIQGASEVCPYDGYRTEVNAGLSVNYSNGILSYSLPVDVYLIEKYKEM